MFNKLFVILPIIVINFITAHALELVIGEERVSPGIIFIFEGAIKDQIMPASIHLPEQETHVHIEARSNWAKKKTPEGTVSEGFVPYLHITAKVTNQKTGLSTFIDLLPHINLIDNFHYARNMSLPGAVSDLYRVKFTILPPSYVDLALHKDWIDNHGKALIQNVVFEYKDVNFKAIAQASRR